MNIDDAKKSWDSFERYTGQACEKCFDSSSLKFVRQPPEDGFYRYREQHLDSPTRSICFWSCSKCGDIKLNYVRVYGRQKRTIV